ncbi:MAG: TRAP transporter large permease subunit, partial [Gammaproteobacteria bacterium]|nr:TRAP transporter large permease subunit [Gammaproteobacteria bacterium]
MNSQAITSKKKGDFWTWAMIVTTAIFAFIVSVELVNILFFDPYDEESYFLFTFAGMLGGADIASLTWIMFGTLFVFLMVGLPLAFVTGGLGVVFIYLIGDQIMLNIIPTRIFPMMTNPDLAAIPLFIFMASMLERAGLIEEMFDVVYKWMGGLNGGLAAATILASTILAAMVGVIGA